MCLRKSDGDHETVGIWTTPINFNPTMNCVFSPPPCLSCSCWSGWWSTWVTLQRRPACRVSFLLGRSKSPSSLMTGAATVPTEHAHANTYTFSYTLRLFASVHFLLSCIYLKTRRLVMTRSPNAVHWSSTMQMFLCKTNCKSKWWEVHLHCTIESYFSCRLILALRSYCKLLHPMCGSHVLCMSCTFKYYLFELMTTESLF